ncbi:MAG: hypothetical protein WCO35_03130 [Candidatus Nomurabacteria bacterium]
MLLIIFTSNKFCVSIDSFLEDKIYSSGFFKKSKGINIYKETLINYLEDGELSSEEKEKLNNIIQEYNLSDKDIEKCKNIGFNSFFTNITSDRRISEDERLKLIKIQEDLGVNIEDTNYSQEIFNKYYSLNQIEDGILPKVNIENSQLGFSLQKGEELYYVSRAFIIKNKLITQRINYSGMTGSIKIMKGLRYKVGSIKVQPVKIETLAVEDSGVIYLSSSGFHYLGIKKHFDFPYTKISHLEIRDGVLYLYKQGKEAPFMISMSDYEVSLAVISFMLNK